MTFPSPSAKYVIPVALSLALLGTPSLVRAEAPSKASVTSADQKIVLQYTPGVDIMYVMHWDIKDAKLPEGVDSIQSIPQENALLVHGTSSGRAAVAEIVSHIDIKRKFVGIKSKLIAVNLQALDAMDIPMSLLPVSNKLTKNKTSDASVNLQFATGANATRLLDAVTHDQTDVAMTFDQMVTNNNTASSTFQSQLRCLTGNLSDIEPIPTNITATFSLSPRINSDNTITLSVSPEVSLKSVQLTSNVKTTAFTLRSSPPLVPTPNPLAFTTLRTVKNGETMVLGIPFYNEQHQPQTELLYFVTAAIVPDKL